ncbi:hypothetical protein U9M48_011818 [Paspalum notatum var. saurae]|uniref:Protein ECERIFERUM 7 n=1 Tax=Paspalum notatum var. saurae TaxID=547442 RepID=A0AAQ3SWA9_PASNO
MSMDQLRWRPTVNERDFIERALQSDLRVDGRNSFDFRTLKITLGREDGTSEVQLGETRVMAYVTAQLVQPYRDRPNEGTLAIFTEFSPMADPAFEAGHPGESAIELGQSPDSCFCNLSIQRCVSMEPNVDCLRFSPLRESRAVDMESLCVVAGKQVWSVRVDLHILDNGGNLIDAANIAALAALSTFRRPECTVGGDDGQQVIVHDPEVRDPIPLTIHHMPIAVTFAYFGEGNIVVLDPTYKEEAVMGGRMTATINSNGDVCAIQKAGGEGVMSGVIMQCLRIASVKAADITSKIKKAVDSYTTEKDLKKVKRLPVSVPQKIHVTDVTMENKGDGELETQTQTAKTPSNVQQISKDPAPMVEASSEEDAQPVTDSSNAEAKSTSNPHGANGESDEAQEIGSPKSLKDAIKPKHKRKKKSGRS